VAAAVAVVVALVGGVVGVLALTSPASNSPSDAVRGLLTAAGNSDVLGVLDHVDPGERDAISGFLTSAAAELQRLGVTSSALDLHHVAGVSATFDNVETSETPLRADLTAVRITGGTVHTHVDPSQLPVGPFVSQHAKAALSRPAEDHTIPLKVSVPIVTVRRGATWYVSIGYTAAEAARTRAGLAPPDPAAAVPAVGADSATGAVDAFVRAIAALDVRRLIELTPPDEMGALHDYAPLFLQDVTDAVSHLPAHQITITALGLSSHSTSGGEIVTIQELGFHAVFGKVTVDLAPGSHCPTITGTTVDTAGLCGGQSTSVPSSLGAFGGVFGSLRGIKVDAGIVTVERDGKWYVSPTRTVLDGVSAVLHAIPSDALQKLADALKPFEAPALSSGIATHSIGAMCVNGGASSSADQASSGVLPCPTPKGFLPPGITCVNGTATVTFPTASGSPPMSMTIPCPPTTSQSSDSG
jgi:hypothetical protein